MPNNIGNYARHAQYWDWSGHDRTAEHDYWYKYAAKFGTNVLIPMCAWGETGAYMAARGMNVTAFDVTPEMVAEGRKRFGGMPGLRLCEGDVRDFHFDIAPADFCFSMDFGHLLTLENVKKALVCIRRHLRDSGGLVVETGLRLPGDISGCSPRETFRPFAQVYPDIKVWKTGETRSDAETGRFYISQTFYAEDRDGRVESFDHAFYLQNYYREEWRAAFEACGFEIVSESGSRDVASWQSGGEGFCIFEAVKTKRADRFRHCKIDLEIDRDYVLERHCRVNYECDTPSARKIPYEQYRAEWFAWPGQPDGFLSALRESMADERTVAEIIRTASGEAVGYLWVAFHGGDERFVWADVQDLYVEENFRRAGVAADLMDYAEQAAKRNGAKVIRSGTGCENFKSQGLHQKMGYYQYRFEYEKVLREDAPND